MRLPFATPVAGRRVLLHRRNNGSSRTRRTGASASKDGLTAGGGGGGGGGDQKRRILVDEDGVGRPRVTWEKAAGALRHEAGLLPLDLALAAKEYGIGLSRSGD
eukprot:scaffold33987_cov124-Isochrysis_galbana.AAC.6